MQYMGGKSRIAKDIASIINEYTKGEKPFVSLFCGSCAIESKVNSPLKICNDKHEYLIAMWQALQNGYVLPDMITREQYYDIKTNLDRDKALSGFVGFCCSFAGVFFGCYAKGENDRNYCKNGKNTIYKDLPALKDVIFKNLDYKNVIIPENAVIYCDPPYADTAKYSTGDFNHAEFWDYMRKLSKNHIVLISEQNAPDDFNVVWQKEKQRQMSKDSSKYKMAIEKLFIRR